MVKDPDELRAVMRPIRNASSNSFAHSSPATWKTAALISPVFRPQEEEGRDLPRKSATIYCMWMLPTRPTGGDMILRVFTNVNPTKPRVWDDFGSVSRRWRADIDGSGPCKVARQPDGSEVIQTRGLVGFTFVKTRRIMSPPVGRVGKASTCSRSLRFFLGSRGLFLLRTETAKSMRQFSM